MENLRKDDSRLLPGFGPGQGIISGQAVRFPLITQVEHNKELETTAIGGVDSLAAAKRWAGSPMAAAAGRSAATVANLDDDEPPKAY